MYVCVYIYIYIYIYIHIDIYIHSPHVASCRLAARALRGASGFPRKGGCKKHLVWSVVSLHS